MRKLAVLILILAAWYFSGMNSQTTIFSAVICAAIIAVIAFVYSRVAKYRIDAYIPPQKSSVYKDTETSLKLSAVNKSRLPVNRFTVNIEMKYQTEKKGTTRKLNGSAAGSTDGETEAKLYYTAPYCGLIEASLKRIRVYDYFGMFSSTRKLQSDKREIFVMPKPKNMNLIMPPFGAYTANAVADSTSDKSGDDHSEIRMIREYREGDLMRHIHRNFSAKTEKLWVKEYSRENDYIFDLVIRTADTQLTTDLLDALYEIVFSVTDSLMQKEVIIRLHWYDRKINGMNTAVISDKASLYEAIPLLYKSDMTCTNEEYSTSAGDLGSDGMLINSNLEWYFLGQHVYTFQKEAVENELIGNVFDLRR